MHSDTRKQLDEFFIQQQQQAYKMAYVLTSNRDDALELVQDSMLKLVQSYAHKPAEEWTLLFYRILQNRIRDFHRRQGIRQLFHAFLPASEDKTEHEPIQIADSQQNQPDNELQQTHTLTQISAALKTLPLRQQQTFLLRAWQEFSTREAAFALSISEGSIKTHYSRAVAQLRHLLKENSHE